MLMWSILFLGVAIIAATFGYTGIAKEAVVMSKTIFFVALVFLVISLVLSLLKF